VCTVIIILLIRQADSLAITTTGLGHNTTTQLQCKLQITIIFFSFFLAKPMQTFKRSGWPSTRFATNIKIPMMMISTSLPQDLQQILGFR